ncbi:methyl-accepting chemotaxis protein [Niveibacterium terrae]|uniref:methyl-accepting chemotaxis protein n=1 Tax=Niveibacterium terrae TaxID=3373598 RepID=UPI003A93E5DC
MKLFTVSARITAMVVLSCLSLLVVGILGQQTSRSEIRNIEQIRSDSLPSVITLAEARQSLTEARVSSYKMLGEDDQGRSVTVASFNKRIATALDKLSNYEKYLSDDEDRKLLEKDKASISAYANFIATQVVPPTSSGQKDLAFNAMKGPGRTMVEAATQSLDRHIEYNKKNVDSFAQDSLSTANTGSTVTIVTIVIALLLVAALGFQVARETRERLYRLKDFLVHVADQRDFTGRVRVTRLDELGLMGNAVNHLLGRLQESFKSITEHAESVAGASEQLAASSGQVASASNQQSEAASNVAATVEEMTVSINHVGDRAGEAARLAKDSEQRAAQGEQVVGQTADEIHAISETVHRASSQIEALEADARKISGVVAVIKEVADQTNLLALNAAIEAARAGEQGRGFAVVADEVRKLAERTALSTQEISTTIEAMNGSSRNAVDSMHNVVERVSGGVARAQQTSDAIKAIGEASRNTEVTVGEISDAIQEQGSATNNIAVQVERIAQMSEESSSAARETSDAALKLDGLAKELQRITSAYRV